VGWTPSSGSSNIRKREADRGVGRGRGRPPNYESRPLRNLKAPRPLGAAFIFSVAALAQAPAIAPLGIVNAASQMPASLPGGKLSPGARIVIPGLRLISPGSPTVIHLKSGSWNASVPPVKATDVRIEADLPADLPAGEIEISVETSQGVSRAETVASAHSSPGIFTLNGEGWGPLSGDAVRHRQKFTIRADGLNDAHPKVFVGGVAARLAAVHGQDLTVVVPPRAPEGCWTPVWIESAPGLLSNFGTLRIAGRDGRCKQTEGWPLRPVAAGQKGGIAIAARIQGSLEIRRGQPDEFTLDSAAGFFFRAGDGAPTPFQALPPAGTCTSYTGKFSLITDLLFRAQRFIGEFSEPLDIGPWLTVGGGAREVKLPSKKDEGQYSGALGGTAPVIWGPGTPLFLEPGEIRIRSEEAKLDVPVAVSPAFDWVNRKDVKEIDRASGVLLQWTGVGADRQVVMAAFNVHPDTLAMGTSLCVALPGATQMEMPPYALANMPATDRITGVPIRGVILATIPRFAAGVRSAAFDDVRGAFLDIRGQTVTFR